MKYKAKLPGKKYLFLGYASELMDLPQEVGSIFWSDSKGTKWLRITQGAIYVLGGYAWDLCTPKLFFGPKRADGTHRSLGAWDGHPINRYSDDYRILNNHSASYPSLIHDVFCQFLEVDSDPDVDGNTHRIPMTRKKVDQLFRKDLIRHNFSLKLIPLPKFFNGLPLNKTHFIEIPLHQPYYYVVRLFGGMYSAIVKLIGHQKVKKV